MNGRLIIWLGLLLVTPLALAQEPEPSVNDSDYDTTAPAEDESYLAQEEADAASTDEASVSDGDFDTSVPSEDTSYLDEPLPDDAARTSADTPLPAGALALAGLAGTALALRRRA